MKTFYSYIKNLFVIVCFVAAGVFAASLLTPNGVVAQVPCEEDECEGDVMCDDNTGNSTYCPEAEDGSCETKVCYWVIED